MLVRSLHPKLLLILLLLTSVGCPSEEKSLSFVLQQFHSDSCDPTTNRLTQGFKVRMTFMRRPEGGRPDRELCVAPECCHLRFGNFTIQ